MVEYKCNSDGLRVRKVATSTGTTDYTLHGKNVVHLTNGTNSLHFYYDAQNRPAIVEFNWVPYAYVHNLQGDIIAIVDANGNKVVEYKYDAWGKPIAKTGSLASTLGTLNPFRYRGYVYDEETGLQYLRSRYFNSCALRFKNSDVTLSGASNHACHNLFSYCGNNPLNKYDPDGQEAITTTVGIWQGNRFFAALAAAFAEPTVVGEVLLGLMVLESIACAVPYNPDPDGRANQKKQGRENKSKSRKKENWKPRNNRRDGKPRKLPKHTPGKDHRKYFAPLTVPSIKDR